MKNVFEVDQKGLCLECGTCAGLCPHNNIKLEPDNNGKNRIHILDESYCEKCPGICLQVCPGYEINVDELNKQVFGKLPDDYWAGNYIQAYLGYSPDKEIRQVSASGGIASALIIHAIETGLINGAYLLTPKSGTAFSLIPALVSDRRSVINAAGSFYWPAPIGQCLRDILRSDGKFAFVGLPCEIAALRKGQGVYKKLKDKIAFTIGLFCGSRPTMVGQSFAFTKYGIELDEVEKVKYRQPEWPGHLMVTMKDGREIHVQKSNQLQGFSSQLFCHPRCLFCQDAIADLADIATGDALRLDDFRSPAEKSILVARTEIGMQVVASARQAKKVILREVGIEKLVHSQHRPIMHKKLALWARLKIANAIPGKYTPVISMTIPHDLQLSAQDYIASAKLLMVNSLTSKAFIRKIFMLMPIRWLHNYSHFTRYS
jgi:coenzyme F420 hydrogenase subunit beta